MNNRLQILNPGRWLDTPAKCAALDRLQARLGARFFDLDQMAEEYHATLDAVEDYLHSVAYQHNLDRVERGLEQVGPTPCFIVGHREWHQPSWLKLYRVRLYSLRPGMDWEFEKC
jgi:hypothetical protein